MAPPPAGIPEPWDFEQAAGRMSGTGFNAAEWLVDQHVAEGRGSRVAYRTAGSTLTYAELQKSVWRAAGMLQKLGIGSGERVLMLVLDEPAFPAVFLGALRIGAVPIPVSTMLKPEEVAVIAADSEARAAVVSAAFSSYLEPMSAASSSVVSGVVVDEGGVDGRGADETDRLIGGVSIRSWSEFTSEDSVAAAATSAESEGFWLYIVRDDRAAQGRGAPPRGHQGRVRRVRPPRARDRAGRHLLLGRQAVLPFGLGNALFFPLSVGARAVIDPLPPTPARVAELAAEHRPTLFFAPPGFCAAMADSGIDPSVLSSARAVVTAGETLPAEVYRRFRARFGVEMLDGIGSTEALHIFCSNHLGDVRPGSTGRVVEGYELWILDIDGNQITEPDEPGALWVRGESVTRGYWQRPDVNAETFVDGWCCTGDVYHRDAEGYYYFVGRNSDMIKARGIWVSPAEVEAVLIEHASVLEAAVVVAGPKTGLKRPLHSSSLAPDRRLTSESCSLTVGSAWRPSSGLGRCMWSTRCRRPRLGRSSGSR